VIDLAQVETDVTKSLEYDTDHPYGQRSKFVYISAEFGVKMYTDKAERDGCMTRQAEAAEYSLGPAVHGSLDLPSGKFRYGYVSQVAVVGGHGTDDSWFEDMLPTERRAEILVLQNELRRQTGFCFTDAKYENCGVIDDTTLVCIDFGEMDGGKAPTYSESDYYGDDMVGCSDDYSHS